MRKGRVVLRGGRLVKIPAEFQKKQTIATRSAGVPNLVGGIGSEFRSELDGGSRGEIPDAGIPGEPIGSEREPLVDRLLNSKLAPSPVCRGHDIGCEVICPKRQARLRLQSFHEFSVDVVARVVATVLHGKEEVVSNNECPAIL